MPFESSGKWLEAGIADIASVYHRKGVMCLKKVDPPTRIIRGQTVMLPNPFLDFVGAWTERGGRAIFLEAKSTKDHRLPLFAHGGLTEKQWAALQAWTQAGAATGLLWGHTPTAEVRFLSMAAIESRARNRDKSIKWEHAEIVRQGLGFITADFAQNLRDWHPLDQK